MDDTALTDKEIATLRASGYIDANLPPGTDCAGLPKMIGI